MRRYTDPLSHVKVAAPCSMDWDKMIGDDRARFCGQCRLNVYNLSGMTREEAERLISSREGRLCVRYYRRADGTILTENCPVGLRAIKKRLARVSKAIASTVLSFLAGLGFYTAFNKMESALTANDSHVESNHVMGAIAINSASPIDEADGSIEGAVMGNISVPSRKANHHPSR